MVVVGFVQGSVVPATTTLVRTPSFDSAIIKSDRLGGNFVYSTVEGHAYAAVAPVVQRVVEPVSVAYTSRQVPLGYATAPFGTYYPGFIGSYYPPQAVFANPIFGGGFPGGAPAAPAPAAPASPPLTGTAIDEDTVAVESA